MNHWAVELVGKPWVFGARGPDAFDCWGLVCYVLATQYGYTMPNVEASSSWQESRRLLESHEEHSNWTKIDPREAQSGDLVFMARNRVPVHVGIYIQAMPQSGVLHCIEGHGVVFQSIRTLPSAGWGSITVYRRK